MTFENDINTLKDTSSEDEDVCGKSESSKIEQVLQSFEPQSDFDRSLVLGLLYHKGRYEKVKRQQIYPEIDILNNL